MIRKYQTVWSGVLLIFILLLSWFVSKGEVQVEAKKVDINPTNIENKDIDLNDIATLSLGQDIKVGNYIKAGNLYYVLGSRKDYPFMQVVIKKDNQLIPKQSMTYYPLLGSLSNVEEKGYYLKGEIKDTTFKTIKQDFFISNNEIIPFYKKQLTMNYSIGTIIYPKYIVIHETDNNNVGADAAGHYKYWSTNNTANSSTHFVVDSKQIYQMLALNQKAWHVGDNKGYSDITNNNSIGIEIAVNSDGDYNLAKQHTIELAARLLKTLNMDISQLKTHNDASGKYCPRNILNESSWDDFTNRVKLKLNELNSL